VVYYVNNSTLAVTKQPGTIRLNGAAKKKTLTVLKLGDLSTYCIRTSTCLASAVGLEQLRSRNFPLYKSLFYGLFWSTVSVVHKLFTVNFSILSFTLNVSVR